MGLVGLDQISGQARYTLGVPELLDGIEIVLVAVGLFAVAEVMYAVVYEGNKAESQNTLSKVYMTRRDWRRSIPASRRTRRRSRRRRAFSSARVSAVCRRSSPPPSSSMKRGHGGSARSSFREA